MITASDGEARSFLLQVQDVTHRRRYEENLHYLATHDPLTGLHNRSSFAGQLDNHADVVRRYGSEGALLLLDLDHFKYVNDTLGHQAGDHVIARVAKVLAGRLRDSDVLARLGGDEFAVLLPKADAPSAQLVADDLLSSLRAERIAVPGTGDRTITASIGVAMFERTDGLTGEDVLVSADLAMYDAKEAGRNQIVLHIAGEHAQARMKGRVTWAQRIREAIDENRFALVAQPIIDLETGIATQFEVLLRMLDSHGDMIPPSAFLSTAERLGMIQEIDAIVVRNAIRAVAEAGEAIGDTRVEINLSGGSMGDPEILRVIERELRETGLDPGRVIFEITETAAIANIAKAREFSDELAKLGCRFALDDFGAGFGSFYYLKHVHFDILKIDGEFVREACATRTDRLVIQAVVAIAGGLGKQTVAEHVGDDATVTLLRALGVDYGQGYFLGEPQPLGAFLARVAETRSGVA
jgi:diguanylate cyclase (GGDEF)-like protein